MSPSPSGQLISSGLEAPAVPFIGCIFFFSPFLFPFPFKLAGGGWLGGFGIFFGIDFGLAESGKIFIPAFNIDFGFASNILFCIDFDFDFGRAVFGMACPDPDEALAPPFVLRHGGAD